MKMAVPEGQNGRTFSKKKKLVSDRSKCSETDFKPIQIFSTDFRHGGATGALQNQNSIINIPYGESFSFYDFFFGTQKNTLFSENDLHAPLSNKQTTK